MTTSVGAVEGESTAVVDAVEDGVEDGVEDAVEDGVEEAGEDASDAVDETDSVCDSLAVAAFGAGADDGAFLFRDLLADLDRLRLARRLATDRGLFTTRFTLVLGGSDISMFWF